MARLSDQYGRRPVLLVALALYLASTLACASAQSADLLIAARFLQGIGADGVNRAFAGDRARSLFRRTRGA